MAKKGSNKYALAVGGMELAKKPTSSMDEDYNLELEYLDSPHEESWWDPGEVLDSRGNPKDGAGVKNKQIGTQKNSSKKGRGGDVVDV